MESKEGLPAEASAQAGEKREYKRFHSSDINDPAKPLVEHCDHIVFDGYHFDWGNRIDIGGMRILYLCRLCRDRMSGDVLAALFHHAVREEVGEELKGIMREELREVMRGEGQDKAGRRGRPALSACLASFSRQAGQAGRQAEASAPVSPPGRQAGRTVWEVLLGEDAVVVVIVVLMIALLVGVVFLGSG